MSMDFDLFSLTILFKIPYTVELSILYGVFWKYAPAYDYSADATTLFMAKYELRMEPLSLSTFGGLSP
jgi:hypothetical protein